MYIVIEGQDATGKTTQVELLAEYLRKKTGKKVVTINEPDGDIESAHALHDIIVGKHYELLPFTQILLLTASRLELWKKIAEPVLKEGGIVVASRNWWSSLAYQGYGQGVSRNRITRLTKELLPEQYIHPDKGVILTLSDEVRIARQTGRDDNSKKDFFESKPLDFQHKVNHGYLRIAKDFNIPTFDASPSIEEIHTELIKLFGL